MNSSCWIKGSFFKIFVSSLVHSPSCTSFGFLSLSSCNEAGDLLLFILLLLFSLWFMNLLSFKHITQITPFNYSLLLHFHCDSCWIFSILNIDFCQNNTYSTMICAMTLRHLLHHYDVSKNGLSKIWALISSSLFSTHTRSLDEFQGVARFFFVSLIIEQDSNESKDWSPHVYGYGGS